MANSKQFKYKNNDPSAGGKNYELRFPRNALKNPYSLFSILNS